MLISPEAWGQRSNEIHFQIQLALQVICSKFQVTYPFAEHFGKVYKNFGD